MEPNKPAISPDLSSNQESNSSLKIEKRSSKLKLWLIWGSVTFVLILILAFCVGYFWYKSSLQSPNPNDSNAQRVIITKGSTINSIALQLQKDGLIKNSTAFQLYYKLNNKDPLQAGEYAIKRNLTVAEIVDELAEGRSREYSITFLPGQNIMDIKATFKKAGFKESDIETALKKVYPKYSMMQQIPAGGDIEGFIFPDTYSYSENYTVENVLQRPFGYMQSYITDNKLEEAYKKHGLSLYQGITLASIIQKEVNNKSDMKHVSQVFHSRLKKGMPLGSDPTFVYPAKKQNLQPHPDLDSPYNTYKIVGLPPGPIANPGKEALYAAAYPATDTDDLYFVAGDDGKTYFSKTNEEHEALTKQHCQERCRLDIF